MSFTTPEEVHRWLENLPKFSEDADRAADFNLERFREFCRESGNPQAGFPSIHVAGTNGKGSTCALLASVYREAGYSVGLYTSPHLNRFNERIRRNGETMPDEELLVFFREFGEQVKAYRLTYFEIGTAAAFWWFDRCRVEVGIIETGLGGRLDATNVIRPKLSIITNVSLDHTRLLGPTVDQIAREKAGIVKEGVPVLTGNVNEEAGEVIRRVARERSCEVHGIDGVAYALEGGTFRVGSGSERTEAEVGPLPPVQAHNLAMAWKCSRILGEPFPVNDGEFRRGVERAAERFPTPARFERLHREREWYFDGAHNYEAVQALKEAVRSVGAVPEAIVVLSMMKDKATGPVLREFSEFKKIYYHTLDTARAAPLNHIKTNLPGAEPVPTGKKTREELFKELETELVIFTGSFYFYATIRDWLTSFSISR